jgi:anti-sigma regulatory factor (Ser/Thr protein kinase)
MMSPTPVVPTTDRSSHVDVTVPLRSEFASIVRLIAASLGADAGFSVDDIDDLRLAMSEVFSSIVEGSAATDDAARVEITFDTAGPGLVVTLARSRGNTATVVDGMDDFKLDELATSIIGVAVDEFAVRDGAVRLVKRGAVQADDQSPS